MQGHTGQTPGWWEGRRPERREGLDHQRKHPVKGVCKDKGEVLQGIHPYHAKKGNRAHWWCRTSPRENYSDTRSPITYFIDPMLNRASRLPGNVKCFIIACDVVSFFLSWFPSVSLKIDMFISWPSQPHMDFLSRLLVAGYENIPLRNHSEISLEINILLCLHKSIWTFLASVYINKSSY